MGADLVYVYYGVRQTIPKDDEEQIAQLENDTHPVCDLAYQNTLHFTWGCLTDGEDFFLLLGHEFGVFGIEGIHEQRFDDPRLAEIMSKTKQRLKAAGICEPPALYVQLQAQY
jgi:hypothetical protein